MTAPYDQQPLSDNVSVGGSLLALCPYPDSNWKILLRREPVYPLAYRDECKDFGWV